MHFFFAGINPDLQVLCQYESFITICLGELVCTIMLFCLFALQDLYFTKIIKMKSRCCCWLYYIIFQRFGDRGYLWCFNRYQTPIKSPAICFWVSVESVSFSNCRAFAIPPQCWTSNLLFWSLNTRFLSAPAAAWLTLGLGLRSRATRQGIPPSW